MWWWREDGNTEDIMDVISYRNNPKVHEEVLNMKLTQHVFKNVFVLKSVLVFFLHFKHFQGEHFLHPPVQFFFKISDDYKDHI